VFNLRSSSISPETRVRAFFIGIYDSIRGLGQYHANFSNRLLNVWHAEYFSSPGHMVSYFRVNCWDCDVSLSQFSGRAYLANFSFSLFSPSLDENLLLTISATVVFSSLSNTSPGQCQRAVF
jgi:hypothetical protein